MIIDRVFHVPNYYHEHEAFFFPGWDHNILFNNQNPLCIEYCTGNGSWITEKAKEFPDTNWVGVEMCYDRVRKVWSKIKNANLSNLIIVAGEAWTFTHYYVKDSLVEEVYINFPDPWPKRKHKKHRLMNFAFIHELARILKLGKKLTFVSDDANYLIETIGAFERHPNFILSHLDDNLPNYGASWFENLWRSQGRKIQYLQFLTV
ncbi:MAG: tRNA (guanine(46)-N(7))-methyltransferase TrmB [Chlamydiales bacterium]